MTQNRVVAEKWLDVGCVLKKEPYTVMADWMVWGGDEGKGRVPDDDRVFCLSS